MANKTCARLALICPIFQKYRVGSGLAMWAILPGHFKISMTNSAIIRTLISWRGGVGSVLRFYHHQSNSCGQQGKHQGDQQASKSGKHQGTSSV
jgi:hypothetical protein